MGLRSTSRPGSWRLPAQTRYVAAGAIRVQQSAQGLGLGKLQNPHPILTKLYDAVCDYPNRHPRLYRLLAVNRPP